MSSSSGEVFKPTMLIVEDNEEILFALELVFQAEGYAVHVAIDLASARARLAEHAIDATLLDMRLAHGDFGSDLVRELADNESSPTVVLLSASPELALPVAREFGLSWVPKPFDIDTLVKTMRIAMELSMRPEHASDRHLVATEFEGMRRRSRG